jgi:ribosomal protein L11 methyltransferase
MSQAGFDAFMETKEGFEAYAEDNRFNESSLKEIIGRYNRLTEIGYHADRIEKRNWNEEWEKNYQPIVVDNQCLIRAHFHQPEKHFPFEIVITPKMSFGTGHHQTTYLMIQNQLRVDHKNKVVMDAGCGTAILSIMASKLGAKEVEAFDIDDWSVINGTENIQVNRCGNINIHQGKLSGLKFSKSFDIILANINKSVLWDEFPLYSQHLNSKGILLLSGFYESDANELAARGSSLGFVESWRTERESWASLMLTREF